MAKSRTPRSRHRGDSKETPPQPASFNDPAVDGVESEANLAALLRDPGTDDQILEAALMDVARGNFESLRPEVERLLEHHSGIVRGHAILLLGAYWGIPEFRALAESMMRNDPADWARYKAVLAWASYDHLSGNPTTLRVLFEIARDENRDPLTRVAAADSMYYVYGAKPPVPHAHVDKLDTMDWSPYERMLEDAERLGPRGNADD